MTPLIDLQQVGHRYASGTEALAGVDLQIARAEFVTLLGPSGCGKSTVLRLMAGLETPTTGLVLRELRGDGSDIGYVFQEPTLMPWATVRDNVALPLRLRGDARLQIDQVVHGALSAVGLTEFAAALPRELSGGMKMRVSIARALVTKPSLLLLDEPFAALDEITRFKLNQDLLMLWRTGAGFTGVFVTHSVYEAVFLSQRIVVMSARPGCIHEQILIDAPYPRGEPFRATAVFNSWCVQVSQALQRASAPASSLPPND